jgi:sigma-B regulation protein RsbU (phosphoserine phosphatase)
MEPGDAIYVYTDGVPEAQNAAKQFFGTDRMLDALNRAERTAAHSGESGEDNAAELKEVTTAVKDALDQFVKNAPQFDDITILSLTWFGPSKPAEAPSGSMHETAELKGDLLQL